MKKTAKLIFINLMVFITLLLLLDFGSLLILEGGQLKNNYFPQQKPPSPLTTLPNYDDATWAVKHFEEFAALEARYRAYYAWRRLPFRGETINIDEAGIRFTSNQDTTLPKAVFFGGSTIWGTGVNDENTIPSHFSKQLGTKYHVLNYGETGYTAYQAAQFLQIKVMQGLRPKLVIAYDGVNNAPSKYERPFAHARETQIANKMQDADREQKTLRLKNDFLKPTRTLLQKLFPTKAEKKSKKVNTFSPERNIAAATELLESWLSSKRLCESIGADFICILQPNIFVGKPNIEHLSKKFKNHKFQNAYHYYEDVLRLMERERYQTLQANFVNMTAAFDNIPQLYIDFCHVSPRGNEIIAAQIVKHLAQ